MNVASNLLFIVLAIALLSGCDDEPSLSDIRSQDWLIPANEVFDGGPGKDGIPSVDNPNMVSIDGSGLSFLQNNELVIGVKRGNDVQAFPIPLLDYHEIVNTTVGDDKMAVTYCPLTGTTLVWEREFNGEETTFGVSGLLYNSNLIPYDRRTDSNWSQILNLSVNGDNSGMEPNTFYAMETTWGTWKEMYPDSKIMNSNTGFGRDYERYPYGNYRVDDFLIFPVSRNDDRLFRKERVLSVHVNDNVKVYRFNAFETESLIFDEFNGQSLVIVGDRDKNYMAPFIIPELNGEALSFTAIDNLPIVMEDQFGNQWDVFGEAISGPNVGEQLQTADSFMGYWFAIATFFSAPEIYEP